MTPPAALGCRFHRSRARRNESERSDRWRPFYRRSSFLVSRPRGAGLFSPEYFRTFDDPREERHGFDGLKSRPHERPEAWPSGSSPVFGGVPCAAVRRGRGGRSGRGIAGDESSHEIAPSLITRLRGFSPGARRAGGARGDPRRREGSGGPGRDALRLSCFVSDPGQAILPAFGAFTGGHLLAAAPGRRFYAVGGERVWEVPQ